MGVIGTADVAAFQAAVASEPRAGDSEVIDLIDRALPSATAATRAVLAQTGRLNRVAPEGLIFRQGEPPPLTLIVRGFGSFRRTTIDGAQHIIGLCAPGAMFGYSAIGSVDSSVPMKPGNTSTGCPSPRGRRPTQGELARKAKNSTTTRLSAA